MERNTASLEAVQALRVSNLGRLLLEASRLYNEQAISALRSSGHPLLTIAHASILPHIDVDGTRLTVIAARAGVTKQTASEMIRDLERLEYLTRHADPDDKRAQKVMFTDLGRTFLTDAYCVHCILEQNASNRLGGETETLRRLLKAYLSD